MAGCIGNAGQELSFQSREKWVASRGRFLCQLVRLSDDGPPRNGLGGRRDVQLFEERKCIAAGGASAKALRVRWLRDICPGFLEGEAESYSDIWTPLFALLAAVGDQWAPGGHHGRYG